MIDNVHPCIERRTIIKIREKHSSVSLKFTQGDVNRFRWRFRAVSQRVDVLICNAGVMPVDTDTTKYGYEIQFSPSIKATGYYESAFSVLTFQNNSSPLFEL
jgi:hypothetical protein